MKILSIKKNTIFVKSRFIHMKLQILKNKQTNIKNIKILNPILHVENTAQNFTILSNAEY